MSDWKLISEATASGASTVEFTDLTGYKIFKWVFIDVNPDTNLSEFQFEGSDDGGSTYGLTTTSSAWHAYNHETSGTYGLEYQSTNDLAQSTSPQHLCNGLGNGADECGAGELFLYNPASETYVKHFYSVFQYCQGSDYTEPFYIGGYWNTTSAATAIRFSMDSGTFSGLIKQYGLVAT